MDHDDHVRLIRDGIVGTTWADLGSGRGAFTLALAELLGPGARIYSVDRDPSALQKQQALVASTFPDRSITYTHADFRRPLVFPRLDGVVMANSLHFIPYKQQVDVVRQVKSYLRPGGRLVIVEYAAEGGNLWVPHPFTFQMWEQMAAAAGFEHTRLLVERPGSFLNGMYSAVST